MIRRAILALLYGAGTAQVITLLASPVLTRLFSPAEFGAYSLLVAAASIFGPVVSLKYDMAIVSARDDSEANVLFVIAVRISLLVSAVVAIPYVYFVFHRRDFTVSELLVLMVLTWFILLVYGIVACLTGAFNRLQRFSAISWSLVVRAAASNCLFVVFGLWGMGFWGLGAAQLLGGLAGLLILGWMARRDGLALIRSTRRQRMAVARAHRKQPLFNAPSALLATVAFTIVLLLLEFSYSSDDVGNYALGYRLLGVPIAVVALSVARVLFASAERAKREDRPLLPTFRAALGLLSAASVATMSVVALVAPGAFAWVFGPDWRPAGVMVSVMAPWFAARVVSESFSPLFIVLGKQWVEMIAYVVLLLAEVLLFVLANRLSFSVYEFLASLSVLYVVVNGCLLAVLWLSLRRFDRDRLLVSPSIVSGLS